jgi:hypothetical protein
MHKRGECCGAARRQIDDRARLLEVSLDRRGHHLVRFDNAMRDRMDDFILDPYSECVAAVAGAYVEVYERPFRMPIPLKNIREYLFVELLGKRDHLLRASSAI